MLTKTEQAISIPDKLRDSWEEIKLKLNKHNKHKLYTDSSIQNSGTNKISSGIAWIDHMNDITFAAGTYQQKASITAEGMAILSAIEALVNRGKEKSPSSNR